MDITYDEQQVMAIYDGGSREETIAHLEAMRGYLEPDETELQALTDSTLEKLRAMTDAEYDELDLSPDFEE